MFYYSKAKKICVDILHKHITHKKNDVIAYNNVDNSFFS